jgi:NitT/TauT family transport system permease protein
VGCCAVSDTRRRVLPLPVGPSTASWVGGIARQAFLTFIVFAVVIALWAFATQSGAISRAILPRPWTVGVAFVELITAEWFPQHLLATATETLLGFVGGGVVAIASGILLFEFSTFRRAVYPLVILFQLTPAIVLAPVYLIWFGFGLTSKVLVSATTAYFVVLLATLAGLDVVGKNSIDLMRSLRASRRQMLTMLIFPNALPFIFAGLRTATTLALIGALVAEFITSQVGLGTLLTQFGFSLQQHMVFATVLVVALFGVAMYAAVEAIQRRIVWWRH